MMQPLAGGAMAKPFKTHHNALSMELFLRIAPELYLKRLLVGGFERVYEINRNFRNEGLSSQHNPEFTMVEFYQAYATYADLMELTEEMVCTITTELFGTLKVSYLGEQIDFTRPWKRTTLREAVSHYTGIPAEALGDKDELLARAKELHIHLDPDESVGHMLNDLLETAVVPRLIQPTFITNYPVEVSPLSRRSETCPEEVDRFELFVGGKEIANAFSELNDPVDQRERFLKQLASAPSDEESRIDEDFLTALEHGMPPAAGEGIGIDRLTMILTDSASIRDVILFPLLKWEKT
jgi:lysyl-tRNA synthetase class 2